MTESSSGRRRHFVLGDELLERVADGESFRSLARKRGIAHTTLSLRLQQPEGVSKLRAARRRLRAQHAKERQVEKKLRKQAREQAARDSQLGARHGTAQSGVPSTDRVSRNDELAAQIVAGGGGVQELIEATGLPTRLNVYESIDPQLVARALDNDDRPPPEAGRSRRFVPGPALIARRAAGESLRSLANDAGVSFSTLSRALARPEVAEQVRLQQLKLQEQRSDARLKGAMLADYYSSRINYIWCPVHHRRTYVRSVDESGSEICLNVEGCCDQATQELVRWLKIHRAILPNGTTFTPSGHAPPDATVPPA